MIYISYGNQILASPSLDATPGIISMGLDTPPSTSQASYMIIGHQIDEDPPSDAINLIYILLFTFVGVQLNTPWAAEIEYRKFSCGNLQFNNHDNNDRPMCPELKFFIYKL